MISYGNSSAWKKKKAFKFRLFFDKKKKKSCWNLSVRSSGLSLVFPKPFTPFAKSTGHGNNVIIIIRKEPNLWALCTSHTVGNNEKAGETFAASRLSNSFSNSLAQLNLCKVQPFWCIKTSVIIF